MKHKKLSLGLVWLGAVGLVLVIAGAVPYSTVTVPEWRIEVENQQRISLSKRSVTQTWVHLTYESTSDFHEDKKLTDDSGAVVFPERKTSASSINRVWGAIKERIDILPHTSYGPHSYVFVDGEGTSLTYNGGRLPGHVIVVEE